MARSAKGWKLLRDPRTEIFFVRFSHGGRRFKLSTSERDSGAASRQAARLYADVVSGRWTPGRTAAPVAGRAFEEVAAEWLADIESTISADTFKLYRDTYVGTHFAPAFKTIDRLTTVGVEDYKSARLRVVTRETLKKELPVLRRFAKWATRRGHLAALPEIETPGRHVVGTRVDGTRKRTFLIFTADEIAAILANLPETAQGHRAPAPFPVRARFTVAWETALRPQTIDQLRAPDDYRPGNSTLLIRDEADKNRFGRELPLSAVARQALDRICPEVGLLFGSHDYRRLLRDAAKAAGIDEYRASRISDYDFRHSRLTHLGQVSDNLSGVMFLAGHKQPATTARYLRPQKHAAAEVLDAAATHEFRSHSGRTARSRETAPARSTGNKPNNFKAVRGRGLEPRWLLTASTSS
jgi:hypothetical protein